MCVCCVCASVCVCMYEDLLCLEAESWLGSLLEGVGCEKYWSSAGQDEQE